MLSLSHWLHQLSRLLFVAIAMYSPAAAPAGVRHGNLVDIMAVRRASKDQGITNASDRANLRPHDSSRTGITVELCSRHLHSSLSPDMDGGMNKVQNGIACPHLSCKYAKAR